MEPLAAQFIERLRHGEPDRDTLARVGDAEPELAAQALLRAAHDPDLSDALERWVPPLLRSARPGFGAQCLAELAERSRTRLARPLDLARTPMLPTLLGSSNVLARLLLRHPEWLDELEGETPAPPDATPPKADWTAIRRAKYRGLLRIASRDLAGRDFDESLAELSGLADRCLIAALTCASAETGVEAPALLALGKLGGQELNFSSDVDLLFLYHPPAGADPLAHNHDVARLIRRFKQQLDAPSDDGFAYRVDLDLRPEGRPGVLANSVDAALTYYESFGAEWERQMLLRLRPLAGPAQASADFVNGIGPFVYRRLIDPGVMQDVRDMKTRIENERRRAGRDVGADLKEGPGGIRDVEFLVQSLQLFFGGREPAVRTGNVLAALAHLARLALLPEDVATALAGAYRWLRRAEHAVQLVEEQQTARFPEDHAAQLGLARRMGYEEPRGDDAHARLLDDHTSVRNAVRLHFDALVLSDAT
jgi:glutamate-ammonia-ligase adenylyltransferase